MKYAYLLSCANNILKLIKRQDLKHTLVSECYLFLMENKDKLESKIDLLESVAVRWMTMQVKWSNTSFKKAWVYPNKHITPHQLEDVESYILIEDKITEEELLKAEIEIQEKLNRIQMNLASMSLDQRFLFQNIFEQGINTSGKLAKHTGLSRTGCYYLIKNIKTNLKK